MNKIGAWLSAVGIISFIAIMLAPMVVNGVLPYALIEPYRKQTQQLPGTITVRVDDSTQLSCLYQKTLQRPALGTVLVIHGIADNKESMTATADEFRKLGYDVFLADMRAHGASEGMFCTYGYREKQDIRALISWLIAKGADPTHIGIFGSSFGASVALQAMAYDSRIAFGIVECPFASLRDVAQEYSVHYSGFSFPTLINKSLSRAENIADFRIDSVRPDISARSITKPILHFHGSDDERIPIEHARRIEAAFAPGISEYHEVKGAHHLDVRSVGHATYWQTVGRFLHNRTL
ncbi:MAG: alpha/beta fold hydrolase [Ignavibacteria bacterium]|nr:alpha/beta fold hydrolase [Ignavibacteria bacterium]